MLRGAMRWRNHGGLKWPIYDWLMLWWMGKPWENHGKKVIYIVIMTGWWFGTMEFHDFPFSWEWQIIPTDFHCIIFQRGRAQPPSSV